MPAVMQQSHIRSHSASKLEHLVGRVDELIGGACTFGLGANEFEAETAAMVGQHLSNRLQAVDPPGEVLPVGQGVRERADGGRRAAASEPRRERRKQSKPVETLLIDRVSTAEVDAQTEVAGPYTMLCEEPLHGVDAELVGECSRLRQAELHPAKMMACREGNRAFEVGLDSQVSRSEVGKHDFAFLHCTVTVAQPPGWLSRPRAGTTDWRSASPPYGRRDIRPHGVDL